MARVIDAVIRLKDEFSNGAQKSIAQMTAMNKSALKAADQIDKAGKTMSSVGTKMTAAFTMPIIGAAVASVKMAADFEQGIAKVSTIADTSSMSIEEIKKGTMDLSREMGIALGDISEAQYNAISAGADTAASLGLVKTAAMAAKAGFTDTSTAIDGLTTVYNSYQGAVDYDAIADQMLVTQNYGKTTFGELAASMGQVTPIASSLNMQTEELFSSMAILTKNGIATSSSAAGLKAALSNILKPTAEAQKAAKKMGLEFNASHLQQVGWAQFMAEVRDKTGGSTQAMAKLFGSVEALNAMTVLTGAGFEDFGTAMGMMSSQAGITEQAYQKMLTPTEKFNIALNKLKVAGVQAGERLLPFFEKFVDKASQVGDKLGNLSDSQIDAGLKMAGIVAAAGPIIMIFGKITSGIGAGIKAFNMAGMAIKGAGGVMALITSPAGLVIMAILAIIATVLLVRRHFDQFKGSMSALSPAFNSIKAHVQSIVGKFNEMRPTLQIVGSTFLQIFGAIVTFLAGMFVSGITNAINVAAGVLDGMMTVLQGIIDFITGVFTGNWEQAWTGVKEIFSGIFQGILSIAKGIINGITSAINTIIGGLNTMKVPDWVPGIGGKGINIPLIPQLAHGTRNWGGGIAQVHERGGEIIDLPSGSRVYPHDESIRKARQEGSMSFSIPKLADQIIVREDADIDRIAEEIVRRIKAALGNRGEVSFSGNMA